jgi:opacity protein-like surface antigen
MKKTILALLLAGVCAAPSSVEAATPYISAYTGLGIAGDSSIDPSGSMSFKSGIPWGGAIGLKGEEFRFEAALGYQINHVDTNTVPMASGNRTNMFSYMANVYYDYELEWNIEPYLMGGLGGTSITRKGPDIHDMTDSVFTWQVGAGVGVLASENIVVDFGYRYFKPGAYKVPDQFGNVKHTASSNNILIGLRYSF